MTTQGQAQQDYENPRKKAAHSKPLPMPVVDCPPEAGAALLAALCLHGWAAQLLII